MTFSPHGFCLLWDEHLLPLMILGHGLIALAYFLIPLGLTSARVGAEFGGTPAVRAMFAGFILLCGMTHVATIANMFVTWYWLEAWLAMATGIVSIFTAGVLPYLVVRRAVS